MKVQPKPPFQPLATPFSSRTDQQDLLRALGIDPDGTKAQALIARHGHTLYLTFKGSQAPLVLKDEGTLGIEVHKAARGKGQKVDHPLPQGFGELALALADAAPVQSKRLLAVALDCPATPFIYSAVDKAFVIAEEACQPTTTTTTTAATTATTTTTTTLSTSPVTTTTTINTKTNKTTVARAVPLARRGLSNHQASMVKAIHADQPKDVHAVLMRASLLNAEVQKGATPLQLAARLGKLKVLDDLLNHPEIASDQPGAKGKTALHEAAEQGQLAAVERLLKEPGVDTRRPSTSGATPFYLAIEHGHLEVAQRLLAHDKTLAVMPGLVLRRLVSNGAAPLHAACKQGTWATAQWLLDLEGVKVQQADREGHTPLMYAIRSGHLSIAELLVAKGADIHHRAKDGSTLLHVACAGGQHAALQWVLRQPETPPHKKAKGDAPRLWNQPTSRHETPLSLAVRSGNASVAELLLQQEGIEPNAADKDDRTPLFWAVWNKDLDMAKALLKHPRTDANRASDSDETPFLVAAAIGQLDMVKLLFPRTNLHLRNHRGDTAVYAACLNLKLDVVQWLLKQPKTLKQKGKKIPVSKVLTQARFNSDTPMLAAIQNKKGSLELVKFLLARPGIDVNRDAENGETPLSRALDVGALEIADLLCSQWKADIHHVNDRGENALHQACKSDDLNTVEWVLDRLATPLSSGRHGVNPTELNARNQDKETPLHRATIHGNSEVVKRLLDVPGIDPNAADFRRATPLLLAVWGRDGDIVEVLAAVPHIAVDHKDEEGATALHWAIGFGELEMIKQLLDAGADIHMPDGDHRTPLQLACMGAPATVRLLLGRPEIHLLNGQPRDLSAVLNQTTPEGKTLLHLAIRERDAKLVQLLLAQKGIDPNMADAEGVSALHTASKMGNAEAVSALLAHPAIHAEQRDRHGHNVLSWIRVPSTAAAVVKAVQDGVAPDLFRALTEARNRWGSPTASVMAQHGVEGDVLRMLPVTPVKKPLKLPTTTYQRGWIIAGGGQPDWDHSELLKVGTKARIPMEACGDGRVDLSWKALKDLPIQPGDLVVCQFRCTVDPESGTHMAVLGQGEVAPVVEVARLLFEKGAMRVLLMRSEVTYKNKRPSDADFQTQLLHRFRNDPNLPRAADPKNEYLGLDYTSVSSDPHLSSLHVMSAGYWLMDGEIQRENPAATANTMSTRSVLPMTTLAWPPQRAALVSRTRDTLKLEHLARLSDPHREQACSDLVFGCFATTDGDELPLADNYVKLRSLLKEHQADPNAGDAFGRTALHLACTKGWVTFAELLHAHGATLHFKDDNGQTPMALACAHGRGQMVEWLLKKGVPADQATPTGHPLLIAIERGHVHVVRLLLDAGAHPETRDLQGRTALELAKTLPNREIAQMLQERPAPGSTTTTTTTTTGSTTTTTQTDTGSTTLAGTSVLKN